MLIWVIFAVMTGAAVLALLRPLSHARSGGFADIADAASLYRAQLKEIERDLARKLIGPAEAEGARAEAARRLIRAAPDEAGGEGETEGSLRRRRTCSALALSSVPLLALLVYGAYGSPERPDAPLAARIAASETGQDIPMAIARIETHLAKNPGDSRGWSVIGPIYLTQGRHDDAARAFSAAIRVGDGRADNHAGLAEARIRAAGGIVTAEARQSLEAALRADGTNPRARYFLAIAKEQDGDRPGAIADLRRVIDEAPAGAEWTQSVRARLSQIEGDAAGSAIAALPAAERQQAIRGMVDGLAARLRSNGGSVAEWARLIRAQNVLGNNEGVREAVLMAREKLGADEGAQAAIEEVVREWPKEARP